MFPKTGFGPLANDSSISFLVSFSSYARPAPDVACLLSSRRMTAPVGCLLARTLMRAARLPVPTGARAATSSARSTMLAASLHARPSRYPPAAPSSRVPVCTPSRGGPLRHRHQEGHRRVRRSIRGSRKPRSNRHGLLVSFCRDWSLGFSLF